MGKNESTYNIALIYLYYGVWPWYFDFFIKTCAYNPEVVFILISDIDPPKEFPKNIKFIFKSLEEIELLASTKLGFKVGLKRAYKLCDFKPAYGFIFDDILSDFDFWGHGDIDLIFGKISDFITPELLSEHDTISVRHDYPSGFFMLYRNVPFVNKLFMRSKDYVHIFSSEAHYCFDECNFQHGYLFNGMDIFDTNSTIESMMHVIKKAENDNALRPYFDFCVCEGIPGNLKWENGILTLNNEYEILLYHFIQLKNNIYFYKPHWQEIPNTFYIEKYSFFKKSKYSLEGFLERPKVKFKVMFKKNWRKTMFKFNKLIAGIYSFYPYQAEQHVGSYKYQNKILTIEKEKKKYYMSLSHPKFSMIKLDIVFKYPSLLVNHDFGLLLSKKQDTITVTLENGQKEVYYPLGKIEE